MRGNLDDEYDKLCKIVLVGDVSVGKTHLLSRYMQDELPKAPAATIGVEFATKTVKLPSGTTVKAQIWDTAGQERYRAITRAHYRRAAGAVLVYDVTRHETFRNCEKWIEEVREGALSSVVVMLVGNKVDLVERDPSARQVSREAAEQFARKHGLLFHEASAVTSVNVKPLFDTLLDDVSRIGPPPTRDMSGTREEMAGGMRIDPGAGANSPQICSGDGGPC
eukprot:TRINITY_DN10086_c0_g2_i1.p1 TRINITY_DN10086_c0_g2~~TRINITY_DN10086_c0_g2_i1.p1  ORF type:complete len:222 (-),score=37.54 TRINITY_DN10086_c0_g2_i1:103-768(-)